MKNKILLGSMTLLSAFILSACGNGEKKTNKTTAATTEAPAPVAVLTNAVEDKVVTAETNAEATESRVLATPLAAKAEQAADKSSAQGTTDCSLKISSID